MMNMWFIPSADDGEQSWDRFPLFLDDDLVALRVSQSLAAG